LNLSGLYRTYNSNSAVTLFHCYQRLLFRAVPKHTILRITEKYLSSLKDDNDRVLRTTVTLGLGMMMIPLTEKYLPRFDHVDAGKIAL